MPSPSETSFSKLVGVPVHYDRLPSHPYGSEGVEREFFCRLKLRKALEGCFDELFDLLPLGKPRLVLSAGTLGDGMNAHGQGLAFDLDGFKWPESKQFMMLDYPANKPLYIGINAHLFTHFSQVLSYYYPNHRDHFHVDFNFSMRYRPESNAQTFFLQSALRYIHGKEIGHGGVDFDGIDGIWGGDTKAATSAALKDLGLSGSLTKQETWLDFLRLTRKKAFDLAT